MMKTVLIIVMVGLLCGSVEAAELKLDLAGRNVNQLHDELLVAFPSWQGTLTTKGSYEHPLLSVQSNDTTITLNFPDGTDVASVQKVISAHVPKPPPPDPTVELTTAITNATTLQELKDALVGKTRAGKVEGRKP